MKKFEINKKQVTQQAFVAPKAYKRALELINEFNGTITSEDKKPIVALFKSKAQAQKFLDQFESEYTVAHEAYAMSKHKYLSPMEMYTWEALAEYAEEDEPKQAEPKKAPSSPKKSKGNKPTEPKYVKILEPFAGKGKSMNKPVAAALREAGMEPTGEAWAYWQSIR